MKRVKTVMYLLGVGYLSLHVGMGSLALADNGHGHGCNDRTLKGTYIFTQDGFENRRVQLPTDPPVPGFTVPADRRPLAYAGREKYDGSGNIAGINTVAQARGATANPPDPGEVVAQPVNVSGFVGYSGTYEVNSDCTAVVEVVDNPDPNDPPDPEDTVFVSKYHLFLSSDGDMFTFIVFSAAVGQGGVFVEEAQEITSVGVAYRVGR
jgi:hypothetical protein